MSEKYAILADKLREARKNGINPKPCKSLFTVPISYLRQIILKKEASSSPKDLIPGLIANR